MQDTGALQSYSDSQHISVCTYIDYAFVMRQV